MAVSTGREHAVVIGGSMAGLLAARVLAGQFQRVTVLERDRVGDSTEARRGVPQGKHTHGLLAGGRNALERLFPGLSQELIEAGALPGDVSADTHWFMEDGLLASSRCGVEAVAIGRPLLEAAIRRRVRALENVEFREGWAADSLKTNEDGTRVTGVSASGAEFTADLTVDASGRGSRTPKWLRAMGYQAAEEEKVEVGIGYTTRRFARESWHLDGRIAAVIPSTPEGKRGGVILAQEGGQWIVTLFSNFGNYAPEELHGFIEAARQLPSKTIYDVIRNATPIGEAVSTRFPASRRRRYERLSRWPAGLVVLGDGICSFNPIYGQGMTSAALQALALEEELRKGGVGVERRFFRRAARVVDTPWSLAVGGDLRIPEVDAPRPLMARFVNWYVARLHQAAHTDARLTQAFLRVTNLLDPPASLLAPAVAWRVFRGNLRLATQGAERDLRTMRAATSESGR